jgi:putative acetyltransferase
LHIPVGRKAFGVEGRHPDFYTCSSCRFYNRVLFVHKREYGRLSIHFITMESPITYCLAATDAAFDCARKLFTEYARSLPIDLSFQQFDQELVALHQQYGYPAGALLLAYHKRRLAGCVGVRELCSGTAELKRLYVRPAYRGLDLGRFLTERALETAKALGYCAIRLDTLASMHAAQKLYRALGFVPIPAYRFNPEKGAVYLEKIL